LRAFDDAGWFDDIAHSTTYTGGDIGVGGGVITARGLDDAGAPTGIEYTARTRSDGRWVLRGLPAGRYSITARSRAGLVGWLPDAISSFEVTLKRGQVARAP